MTPAAARYNVLEALKMRDANLIRLLGARLDGREAVLRDAQLLFDAADESFGHALSDALAIQEKQNG